jgi:hypothetical protein
VTFLAEGPDDPDYFLKELEPWLGAGDVEIARLQRNSPLWIEFTASDIAALLPLIAVFLAVRVKLEIIRLKSTLEKEHTPKAGKGSPKKSRRNLPAPAKQSLQRLPQSSTYPLFSVSTGWITAPKPGYELRVLSLMPGSLLLDLKLNVSTTVARRLRSVLLNLLTDSPGKSS